MIHPGQYISHELKQRQRTQKQFAELVGKKVSEVNELINGKRNITIAWDMLLCFVFDEKEGTWSRKQYEYDYFIAKAHMDKGKRDELSKKKQQIQKQDVFSHF